MANPERRWGGIAFAILVGAALGVALGYALIGHALVHALRR